FLGWPRFLLRQVPFNQAQVLTLDGIVGRTERQWKSILSWMLGVAFTRRVLTLEGYRWIAPVSAFYAEAVTKIKPPPGWPKPFLPGRIEARRRKGSKARLRPDYLCLGRRASPSAGYNLVVAESKGTRSQISDLSICRSDWKQQARNITITRKASGRP